MSASGPLTPSCVVVNFTPDDLHIPVGQIPAPVMAERAVFADLFICPPDS